MKKIFLLTILFVALSKFSILSQTVIEIKPLFEYPVAPANLESLEDKCNYLMKNFWNDFDFKIKQPLDQHALNEAFSVYVTPMQYADKKEVDQSIDKLLNKISGNPILSFQFTIAAEENLYGPRADYWNEEIYLKFVDALVKNKKVKDSRKTKYLNQANALRHSNVGNSAPSFQFLDKNGNVKNYFPMSTPTLLIFGDPEDTDWRLSRLKLDSNFVLEEAINKGKVNILYIIPEGKNNWQQAISNYSSKWTVGSSSDISDKYDTRVNPSIYIIGSDGKIQNKLAKIEPAIEIILQTVN